MNIRFTPIAAALSGLATIFVAGCGGGSDTSAAPPVATTTAVSTTVIDGAIGNALVCIDRNDNGVCDAGETQGRTDADGKVTLDVPDDDVGKYPIVASVGTDAIDADHGAVMVGYTLSTPADQTAVVSPLTTLVQRVAASTGASTAEATKTVQDAIGASFSLFADYTAVASPTDSSLDAATLARMIVLATQQQQGTLRGVVGSPAVDGAVISQADLDKAIQKKVLELLPQLVSALSSPEVLAATTPAARDAALGTAATSLLADGGLTPAAATVVVAINNNQGATQPAPAAPAPFIQLNNLTFTDANNYFVRLLTGSLAQDTPDASGSTRFVDRRLRSNAGTLARWSSGSDPTRNADLNWNGSAWVNCPLDFENISSGRDSQGNSSYSYCNKRETGRTSRATFDVSGKSMATVYSQIASAGYTNLSIADPGMLGAATFPTGSLLYYQTNVAIAEAYAYYPGGAANPAGLGNVVTQYSAAVAAGGTASAQPAGSACNSNEAIGNGTNAVTLEGMIAAKAGTPCIFAPGSFVYGGVTYSSGPRNDWWGNSTVSLGKVGTAPVGSGTAPGFFSGNTLLRVAFKGTGTRPVTYYACQERFSSSSPRNCDVIGTGSYTIETLGDGRAMTFDNLPVQAGPLNYRRVFVERGGLIYFGYQSKPLVTNAARLNGTASQALLIQLGAPVEDPSVPLALTSASYLGTWDLRNSGSVISSTNGTTVFINGDGSKSCQDRATSAYEACTVTITDPATGAFTVVDGTGTFTGRFDFLLGSASGTYHDPSATPVDGSFVGGRR